MRVGITVGLIEFLGGADAVVWVVLGAGRRIGVCDGQKGLKSGRIVEKV